MSSACGRERSRRALDLYRRPVTVGAQRVDCPAALQDTLSELKPGLRRGFFLRQTRITTHFIGHDNHFGFLAQTRRGVHASVLHAELRVPICCDERERKNSPGRKKALGT
jgi:hypothetical protein